MKKISFFMSNYSNGLIGQNWYFTNLRGTSCVVFYHFFYYRSNSYVLFMSFQREFNKQWKKRFDEVPSGKINTKIFRLSRGSGIFFFFWKHDYREKGIIPGRLRKNYNGRDKKVRGIILNKSDENSMNFSISFVFSSRSLLLCLILCV